MTGSLDNKQEWLYPQSLGCGPNGDWLLTQLLWKPY